MVAPGRLMKLVLTVSTEAGTGSPHGVATIGQNGEPWSTRLRRYQPPPTTRAASVASASGRASARRREREDHSAAPSSTAAIGTTVVFVPIDSAAASTAGASSTGRSRASAQSAAQTTSQATAGGSVMLPLLCHASTQGTEHSAAIGAAAAARGTPSARRPTQPPATVSANVTQGQSTIGTKLCASP